MIGDAFSEAYANFVSSFPAGYGLLFNLTFFTAIIVIYALFTYYFCKFLTRKNIVNLNLNQYNTYDDKTASKVFGAFLYILEYIILIPIATFFWFFVLSILILVMTNITNLSLILAIATAVVTAIRITIYINPNISKDMATLFPYTILILAIIEENFFAFQPIWDKLIQIPYLFSNIPYYIIFIVILELVMRIFDAFDKNVSLKED